jgi:hypothetical protein
VVNGRGFKNVVGAAGMRIYHNTIACDPGMCLGAVHSEYINNLFMPGVDNRRCRIGFKMRFITPDCKLDYNAHRVPTGTEPTFQLNARGHGEAETNSLEAMAEKLGFCEHSMTVPDYSIFQKGEPEPFGERGSLFYPKNYDLRLVEDAPVIDKGKVIPNVNDDFNGDAPDLGAYEHGEPRPVYGPRR